MRRRFLTVIGIAALAFSIISVWSNQTGSLKSTIGGRGLDLYKKLFQLDYPSENELSPDWIDREKANGHLSIDKCRAGIECLKIDDGMSIRILGHVEDAVACKDSDKEKVLAIGGSLLAGKGAALRSDSVFNRLSEYLGPNYCLGLVAFPGKGLQWNTAVIESHPAIRRLGYSTVIIVTGSNNGVNTLESNGLKTNESIESSNEDSIEIRAIEFVKQLNRIRDFLCEGTTQFLIVPEMMVNRKIKRSPRESHLLRWWHNEKHIISPDEYERFLDLSKNRLERKECPMRWVEGSKIYADVLSSPTETFRAITHLNSLGADKLAKELARVVKED